MLACAQLGVTLCSIGLGAIAEPAIAHAIEGPLESIGVPAGAIHPIAFAVALVVVVYLHVVIGEMVPKNLSVTMPERAALLLAPPLVLLARIFGPIVIAINWLANHFLRLTGVMPRDEVASTFTADEVQSIVERSRAEGVLDDDQGLLSGALEFSQRTARDVMVPCADLFTLGLGPTPNDVEEALRETGFSRFAVAAPDGGLVGYVHIKDVLDATALTADQPLGPDRIRALPLVAPNAEIEDVLVTMQRTGAHLTRVGDDEGVQGIVFLEDILEELVGEVRDDMQRRDAGVDHTG